MKGSYCYCCRHVVHVLRQHRSYQQTTNPPPLGTTLCQRRKLSLHLTIIILLNNLNATEHYATRSTIVETEGKEGTSALYFYLPASCPYHAHFTDNASVPALSLRVYPESCPALLLTKLTTHILTATHQPSISFPCFQPTARSSRRLLYFQKKKTGSLYVRHQAPPRSCRSPHGTALLILLAALPKNSRVLSRLVDIGHNVRIMLTLPANRNHFNKKKNREPNQKHNKTHTHTHFSGGKTHTDKQNSSQENSNTLSMPLLQLDTGYKLEIIFSLSYPDLPAISSGDRGTGRTLTPYQNPYK